VQGVDLLDISMTSTDAGWAISWSTAYQYDGTDWNERSTGLGNGIYLKQVSALGLNDAWGVTSGYCGSYSQIMHWDGSQWNMMLPSNTYYDLSDISMTGTGDGWAVGRSCVTGPIVLHYDGSNWTPIPVPSDPTLGAFLEISVTGPDDIWAVGNPYDNTRRAIYHYDGGIWTSWLLPESIIPLAIYMADDNEGWLTTSHDIWHWDGQNWSIDYSGRYFTGVSGAGGQVWGVGLTDLVMGRTGADPWVQQRGGPTEHQLNRVAALNAEEAWAVGNAGTILHYSAGDWQPITTTISADLYGLQMLSSSDGYAVGGISGSSGLIAYWDGTSWQQVMTTATTLRGIYMLNSGEGWAVGDGGAIWHGAGSAWTQVANPTTYSLHAIAMDSLNHGWAVGGYRFGRDYQSVILEYDGTQWVDRSNVLPLRRTILNDLTLATGGAEGLLVGGNPGGIGAGDGSIHHLSGGVWSLESVPPPVYGVTLDVGSTAWVVGDSASLPVADYYTGSAWEPVPLPIGGAPSFGRSTLYGVAMVPGQVGWAVGTYGSVLRYTPAGSPTATATSTATGTSSPTSTATLSPSSTTTVPPTSTQTAIELSATLTGTSTSTPTPLPPTSTPTAGPTCGPDWMVVPVPIVGSGDSELSAVVSLAADDIWAVGVYYDGQLDRSLALHWDGSQWASIAVPNYGSYSNDLTSVAASAPNDVWAAGWYYDIQSSHYKGLVVHWDGSQWTVADHMDLGPQDLHLRAVTVISSSDVWVVGDFALTESVAFHWDGQAWTRISTPNPGSAINRLSGIDALSSTDVWAVGDYDNNPGQYSLILHWDGNQWSQITGPSIPPGNQVLASVAAISPNDIWAVGYYCAVECGPGHPDETFAIHWDGSQWARMSTPTASGDSFLLAVTAVSPTDVWSVGWDSDPSAGLIEHWDGSQWSIVPAPNSPNTAHLYGVSAVSSSNVWVVGTYFDAQSGLQLPLIEHYNLCPTATPSATASDTPTQTATPVPSSTGTLTPTPTLTASTSSTPADTATNTPLGTDTPAPSPAITNSATPATCTLSFEDVPPNSTFYPYIRCLACLGIINGYQCGEPGEPCNPNNDPYFRPGNDVTRGQLSKIVSNAAGFSEPHTEQSFEDVAIGSTFYDFIERLASRSIINGYPCGGAGEPCGPGSLPYFRPSANVTRGQTSKIVAIADALPAPPTGQQSFEDVPEGSTFWSWIEALAGIGAINGYPCGGPGEPCGPTNRPYFRPAANVTRGQASKIVSNTFFPNCEIP
jgi:hypothetical protein